MPKQIDIEIFPIAQTKVNATEVRKWLSYLEINNFTSPKSSDVTDPAYLIALAAKRCYMSFEVGHNLNLTKVRESYVDYFDNLLKSKHGSVFEHASYSFAIEGVSRVFTAEMNRHRAGWAISEGSLRFIRFDKDIPFWMPLSLQDNEFDDEDLQEKKEKSREIFMNVFGTIEQEYSKLLDIWDMGDKDKNFQYKKKITSCLRRIVPLGVATGGVWTGNIRALRHVIAMRTDPAAEEEISTVFFRIAQYIILQEPLLFKDFKLLTNGRFLPENWKI